MIRSPDRKFNCLLPSNNTTLFRDLLYAYRVYLVMAKTSEPINLLERLKSMDSEPFPYPGTNAARRHGCLCPDARPAQGTMEDPWILDVHCPLHGESAYEEHKKGPRH